MPPLSNRRHERGSSDAHPNRATAYLTGHTLVLLDPQSPADRTAGKTRGRLHPPRTGPYAQLLTTPGAAAFTLGNLLARLPSGMFTVSAVLMISHAYGSYALAGAVTAVGLGATSLVGPLVARLVDRYGQSRAGLPAALLAVCGSLALVLCVRHSAPSWTLFACYAATATTPNTGGMSRARWAYLFPDDDSARHRANSLEQALDEVCYTLGPALAGVLCTAVFPEAGTLTAAALLAGGMLLFTAQRRTEPPPAGRQFAAGGGPLRLPAVRALLPVFLAAGTVFGSMEVVTLAFADAQGHRSAGGAVLALQAVGSGIAGLVFGARAQPGRAAGRLLPCTFAMATAMCLPLLAAGATTAGVAGLPLVALALLFAGTATAPTMVTAMTVLQDQSPPHRLNEAMTLAVTAILCGIATGSALGGQAAETLPEAWPYTLPCCAALLTAGLAWAGRHRMRG